MAKENTKIDRMVKLDISNYNGEILERWKAPASNKTVGRRIIIRLKEIFGIRSNEIQDEEDKQSQEDREILEELYH